MDIQMPGGLGFTIREHLEALKIPETPIVFISGSKKRGLRKSARDMGAAGFFEKPFDTQKLLDCIASTLKGLPAKKRNCSNASSTSAPATVGRRRILVLEDDRDIASALEVRLNAAGYEVWVARNGLVALELARSHQPDLLLSDVRMPMGFGCSIIDHLAQEGLPDLPVIFMTASKEKSLRKAAEQLGAAGFFEKPYDPETLLGAISNALNSRSGPARASN
jgi:CheY-like chemotaxis protein